MADRNILDALKNENIDVFLARFFKLKSHLFYNLAILFAGLMVFIFVPFFILDSEQSARIFNNGREAQVVGAISLLVGAFYLLLASQYWLFTLLRLRGFGVLVLTFVFLWVALSGFLFSLTTAHGMFELASAPTNEFNFRLVTVLSAILSVWSITKYAKMLFIFMPIYLAVSILPTIPRAFAKFERKANEPSPIFLSEKINVLVIGFDGVPGHLVADLFKDTPEYAEPFKDFVLYENAASSSPATFASIMGIMQGNHDFSFDADPLPVDWRNLYFNDPEKYNLYTNSKYNKFNKSGTKLSVGQFGPEEQIQELVDLYKNVALRLTTRVGVIIVEVINENLVANKGARYYTSDYEGILNLMTNGSDKPSIVYTHFIFTHIPVRQDEFCNFRAGEPGWAAANQNEAGLRAQAKCAVTKFAELIDKLKLLGVYDNTMIILNSDHGKPVFYYTEPPHNYRINGNPRWGFDRYQPLLMIKGIGHQRPEISYSKKVVILDDIAQTACGAFEPSMVCDYTPGVNILDDTDVPPKDFFIHVVKDERGSWRRNSHKAVRISREIPLEQAMKASPEIELSELPKGSCVGFGSCQNQRAGEE